MNDEQTAKLKELAEAMEIPNCAAVMLTHSVALMDATRLLLEIMVEEGTIDPEDQVASTALELTEDRDVQEDLLRMAEWFERHPHSNNNVWLGTHACEAYYEQEQREEE